MTDDRANDDGATPKGQAESARKEAKARKMIGDLVNAGWKWDSAKNMLTHPGDGEVNIRIDPDSYDVLHSAKLVDLLRRQAQGEPQG